MIALLAGVGGVILGVIISRLTLPAGKVAMLLRQLFGEARAYVDHLDGLHDPKLCPTKTHVDILQAINTQLIKCLMKIGV